jgi:hypothetical protein
VAEPAVYGSNDVETHGELELGALTSSLEHPGGALGKLKRAWRSHLRPIPWLEEEGPPDPGCRVSHRCRCGRLREMTLVVSGAGAQKTSF